MIFRSQTGSLHIRHNKMIWMLRDILVQLNIIIRIIFITLPLFFRHGRDSHE